MYRIIYIAQVDTTVCTYVSISLFLWFRMMQCAQEVFFMLWIMVSIFTIRDRCKTKEQHFVTNVVSLETFLLLVGNASPCTTYWSVYSWKAHKLETITYVCHPFPWPDSISGSFLQKHVSILHLPGMVRCIDKYKFTLVSL